MVDLGQQLTQAQAEAVHLADQLAALETKLATAVAGQEFATAETLKAEIPPVREAWALAEARARALAQVIAELAKLEAARQAEQEAGQRRLDARQRVETALAQEREALADIA